MIQSTLREYNASSQLISSVKRMFVESPNARKVMRVWMVNSFQFNGMETQGFPSANSPASFRGTRPAVQNRPSCQTKAKGAFDLLTHHKTKQL